MRPSGSISSQEVTPLGPRLTASTEENALPDRLVKRVVDTWGPFPDKVWVYIESQGRLAKEIEEPTLRAVVKDAIAYWRKKTDESS